MVETKKFEELSISKSIVLKNKHIAILLKHKIESLNKFVQYKIEELEPIKKIQNDIDKELEDVDTDINMTPKSLDTLNSQIDQRNE